MFINFEALAFFAWFLVLFGIAVIIWIFIIAFIIEINDKGWKAIFLDEEKPKRIRKPRTTKKIKNTTTKKPRK